MGKDSKRSTSCESHEEGKCFVLHCFKNHKEYERWYKSFK